MQAGLSLSHTHGKEGKHFRRIRTDVVVLRTVHSLGATLGPNVRYEGREFPAERFECVDGLALVGLHAGVVLAFRESKLPGILAFNLLQDTQSASAETRNVGEQTEKKKIMPHELGKEVCRIFHPLVQR